ncbi:MAG: hypothetical protein WBQ23_06405 [Bacteroidota bacterium]
MSSTHVIRLGILLTLCFWSFLPSNAHAQEDRTISYGAQQVVSTVVGEKGHTYLGQGSWLNEKKKFGTTSDVDLESFINKPKPTDPAKVAQWEREMMEQWKQSQRDLIQQIKKQYPPEKAREMLNKMNVYPPSQVMDDAKDGAEALNKFKKYNSVPNLGGLDDLDNGVISTVGEMDKSKLNAVTEGVYGPDARRWIQQDRMKPGNGRVFYKDPKTGTSMSSRLTDLEHLIQGGETFTAKGSANISSQLIDKIFDDIRAGDPRKAAKSLERLKAELQILKNKSGVHVDISEIDDLLNAGNVGKAKDLLAGAKLRCELLKRGGGQLSLAEKLLEKGGKASAKLMEALSKIPLDKVATVLNGVFITFQAIQMGADISKGNYAKALIDLGLAVSPMAIGILGALTNEMLEAAKEFGFNLVAGRQECFDMLSGIYPDNPVYVATQRAADVSMATLLLKYAACEENDLATFIRGRASNSSDKADVVAINEAKCLQSVIPGWQQARATFGLQFKNVAENMQITVSAKPLEDEKRDEGLNDFEILDNLREEFMRYSDDANQNADELLRYVSAFQNAIGTKDASPCKNPSVAYFYRMAKLNFEYYSSAVSRMAETEYRMQLRLASAKKGISAPKDENEPPKPGKTVRATIVFMGNSFETLKPELDGYARMVCGEGGYTSYLLKWYLDGDELVATGMQYLDFDDVQPGPHNIECALSLFPYGTKDKTLEGLGYRAEFFGGTQITLPPPPADQSAEIEAKQKSDLERIVSVEMPMVESILTEKLNRTASLGEQFMACTEQLRSFGCDLTEVEKLGDDIAENGIDPETVNNGLREICGDGIDNNGNGVIDEDCTGDGTVVVTVWDSGSLADDSFTLSVTGYGNLGSTPAGGQRRYMLDLPAGTYTATLTCILAPDDAGTFSIEFSGSASGTGGSGTMSAGGAESFEFTVQ